MKSGQPIHVYGFPLGEELARCLPLLAGAAGTLLHSAKWDVELDSGAFLVDLDDTGVDLISEAQRTREIVREDARGQPVARVVGQRDRFFVRASRQQRRHRSKNLL